MCASYREELTTGLTEPYPPGTVSFLASFKAYSEEFISQTENGFKTLQVIVQEDLEELKMLHAKQLEKETDKRNEAGYGPNKPSPEKKKEGITLIYICNISKVRKILKRRRKLYLQHEIEKRYTIKKIPSQKRNPTPRQIRVKRMTKMKDVILLG